MSAHNDTRKGTTSRTLENIPTELLMGIVTQIPDLITLDCLLRASPVVSRLFDKYAVEITEGVLSAGLTHGHIQVIIRIVTLIRSSALPIKNLADFQSYVTHEAMYYSIRKSPAGFAPERLSNPTRPAILRSILATNRHITCQAFDCLGGYLSRFRTLRPKHPIDVPDFHPITRQNYIANSLVGIRSEEFKVRDVGPPSWQEEQRAIRAFWRLQVFYDLKSAAAHAMLDWPEADIVLLKSCEAPVLLLYRQGLLPMTALWEHRHQIHPEYDELSSIVDYVNKTKEKAPSDSSHANHELISSSHREVERKWSAPLPIKSDWSKMMSAASGPAHYRSERLNRWGFCYGLDGRYSPWMSGFERYGQFGFAFWDYKRLWESGFKAPPDHDPKSRIWFYYFAWQSILSNNSIEELEGETRRLTVNSE